MKANYNYPKKIAFLENFIGRATVLPLATAGVREWLLGARAEVSAEASGWDEPEVAAEEQKQEQDTYLEILHWNTMALSSFQLSHFGQGVWSSLSF